MTVRSLLAASHPGPAAAVTTFATALAVRFSDPVEAPTVVLVAVAVLSGQLVVGWTNDLLDRHRDRASGRTDKPLATGALSPSLVRRSVGVAGTVCVIASMLCGLLPGTLHLVLGVGFALAYNLVLKSTVLSWLPYSVAFGTLPVVVQLTVSGALPPPWMVLVGALLGFGAHLVNVLPDMADDAATGIRGLAHRLPASVIAPTAAGAMTVASVVGVVRGRGVDAISLVALAMVFALAAAAVVGRGRTPFRAAIGIAAINILVLLTSA